MIIFDTPVDRSNTHSIKWSGLPSEETIPMCIADMDFLAPAPISRAIQARAAHEVYGYTGTPESFYDTIAAWILRRYRWAIQPSWISMHQGVVASLCTAIRALTRPGEKVIIQTPVYHPFFSVIRNNQRVVVENPLLLDRGHYRMDIDLFEKQARDARLFILCSPHNPVGRVWTAEELTRIGQICLRYDIPIVSDDIHADFALSRPYIPLASLGEEFAQLSVTCLSPSKTFNIAGLHTSYEIIPNPALREKIKREKEGSAIGRPNLFGLVAMEQAYTACDDWLDELLHYLYAGLALIREQVEFMNGVELIEPEGTYLAWLDCRQLGHTSDALAEMLLRDARVRLNSGSMFGAPGEGFLRMNYATNHATLATALTRISNALPR